VTASELERLFRAHGPMVLRRARRILGDADEAREALQDIFASLLDPHAGFRGRSSMTTWLYGITTHHCLNRLRDRKNRARLLDEAHLAAPVAAAAPAEAIATAADLLARMPEELATVVVHYYLDEMSHAEIARLLGCSRRHVGDLLERARSWFEDHGRRVAS
jgi:RNA polymerase sigma-70 factor (ECF subfamily)